MSKLSGGCQWGRVRYKVQGDLQFSCVCHCPSCRRAVGAPVVGWAMFQRDDVVFEASRVSTYASSDGVVRSFCPSCGTSLFFEADYIPGLIDVTTESFDDPGEVMPVAHIWTRHETALMRALGGLDRYDELPPQD